MVTQSVSVLPSMHLHLPYVSQNHELYNETRHVLQRIRDLIISLLRELRYAINSTFTRWNDAQKTTYDHCDKKKEWRKDSSGCVVFLTGVNSHPGVWKHHLAKLNNDIPVDRFVPYVPENGDCQLEVAAEPIYKVVHDYTKAHPSKRICLIGVSNGARIATYIETKLRKEQPSTPVKVSSVAGAHFGSRWANYIQKVGLKSTPKHSPVFLNELVFGSKKAKELLDEVQKPLSPDVKRSYQFYASTEDLTILDICASIPKTGSIERTYSVLHGYGHSSIVRAVADQQIRDCLRWFSQRID